MSHSDGNNINGRASDKVSMLSAADVRERLWAYEDFASTEEPESFNVTSSFISLGFIWAAIKRTRRFWLALAALGMLLGAIFFVKFPVSYVSTVSVSVKNDPGVDAVSAMETQVEVAESNPVAAATVKSLGLNESVNDFQAAYTAAATTNQIITITLHAPSSDAAVKNANTLAKEYLAFRADTLQAQTASDAASYQQQIVAAQQQVASLQKQVTQLQGSGNSAQLTSAQNQLKTATTNLPNLEQTVTGTISEERATTASMINGSQVLDAATVGHHSTIKDAIEYVLIGLIGGLALGLGIVVVREIISDRLRRRDDIAAALGAPVRLSVGPLRAGRLPLGRSSAADRERAAGQVGLYLRNAALRRGGNPATLALVAVDNAADIAPVVADVARRCVDNGTRLVIADLTAGAPVARLLGADGSGTQAVKVNNVPVVIVTPEEEGRVMAGPLIPARPSAGLLAEPVTDTVETAARKADLVLTVTELDPAVGADALSTWATQAVAVFTAGRSHANRVYSVGEMLRLSGIREVSAVVVGSDETDKSLGALPDEAPLVITPNGGKPGDLLR